MCAVSLAQGCHPAAFRHAWKAADALPLCVYFASPAQCPLVVCACWEALATFAMLLDGGSTPS
jgi:hypothetical protein